MSPIISVLILFVILLSLLFIGIPIAFSMGLSGIIGIIIFIGPTQLSQIPSIIFNQGTSSTLLVAPLFILMSEILIVSGISKDLFEVVYRWFSRVPGSLAVSTVLASAGLASVTGSSPATVATIGGISAPEMHKRNYSKRLSSGAIVTGGTLGILIPPSVAMVIYGIATETSIVKLFIAGIVPGITLTLILSLVIIIYALIRPEAAPKGEKFTWNDKFSVLKKIIPILVLVITIIYSMYAGLATPTEAAGVGVFISIIISLAMRRLTLSGMKAALIKSARTSSMVLMLIFGGTIFAFVVNYLDAASLLLDFIAQFDLNRWVVMSILLFILLILGMVMDPLSLLILTMSFMFPVVVDLGFDPVWFGVVVTVLSEIGMITAPVGLNLFVLKGMSPELDLVEDIIKGAIPFVFVLIGFVILLCFFPGIALVLL